MQETEITLQSVRGWDSVVKPWCWDTHQFACKGGEVLLGRPPAPSDRYPGLAEETNSREQQRSAQRELPQDWRALCVVEERLPLLGEGGSCSGPSSWGHWQASRRSLVPGVCRGEDWLVLAVFSHFKHSYSVLLWYFVCFVWFCFLLFSPLEEKHHVPHSGAVFWTSRTAQKPFGFWFWCLLALCVDKQPSPNPAVTFSVLGQVRASGAIKDKNMLWTEENGWFSKLSLNLGI